MLIHAKSDEPPSKRRKVKDLPKHEGVDTNMAEDPLPYADFDMAMDPDMGAGFGGKFLCPYHTCITHLVVGDFYEDGNADQESGHLRSSEV